MCSVKRCGTGLILSAIACSIAAAALSVEVRAEDSDDWGQTEVIPSVSHFELWAGAQAFKRAWSLYSGTTVAPFAGIQEDGLRLRVVGGYGAYSFRERSASRRRLSISRVLSRSPMLSSATRSS